MKRLIVQADVKCKGCDSYVDVNIFSNFKSCYKWNIYLALNNMY